MEELKPCPLCGRKTIIEHWSSGGTMYMVKCNNPDCPVPVTSYPTGVQFGRSNYGMEQETE